LCCVVLCCVVLCCVVLCCVALCCVVLCCVTFTCCPALSFASVYCNHPQYGRAARIGEPLRMGFQHGACNNCCMKLPIQLVDKLSQLMHIYTVCLHKGLLHQQVDSWLQRNCSQHRFQFKSASKPWYPAAAADFDAVTPVTKMDCLGLAYGGTCNHPCHMHRQFSAASKHPTHLCLTMIKCTLDSVCCVLQGPASGPRLAGSSQSQQRVPLLWTESTWCALMMQHHLRSSTRRQGQGKGTHLQQHVASPAEASPLPCPRDAPNPYCSCCVVDVPMKLKPC
jgi:hypothetical protein